MDDDVTALHKVREQVGQLLAAHPDLFRKKVLAGYARYGEMAAEHRRKYQKNRSAPHPARLTWTQLLKLPESDRRALAYAHLGILHSVLSAVPIIPDPQVNGDPGTLKHKFDHIDYRSISPIQFGGDPPGPRALEARPLPLSTTRSLLELVTADLATAAPARKPLAPNRPSERRSADANAEGITAAYESATLCLSAATVLAIICENAASLPRKAQAGVLVDAAPLYAELIVAVRAAERDLWPVLTQIRVTFGDARQPAFRFGEIEGTTAIHTVVRGARDLISRTGFAAFAPHFKHDHPCHHAATPLPADFKDEVRRALRGPWESSVLPAWRTLSGVSKHLERLKVQLDQEADEAHAKWVAPLKPVLPPDSAPKGNVKRGVEAGGSHLSPKRAPGRPTRPASLAYASKRWFGYEVRKLKGAIEDGAVAAEQVSPRLWHFDLGEVAKLNPKCEGDASADHRRPRRKRRRRRK